MPDPKCTHNPNTCQVAFCKWPSLCEEEEMRSREDHHYTSLAGKAFIEAAEQKARDETINNPLTNTCKIFATGSCNLEDQLEDQMKVNRELKNILDEAISHLETLMKNYVRSEQSHEEYVWDFINATKEKYKLT